MRLEFGRYRIAEKSLRTKHVVAAGRFVWDAGSTPAASTILNDAMTSRIVKTAVTALLGFVLACQGVFLSTASAAASSSSTAKVNSCCHGCGTKHCSTSACCAKPAENQVPLAPVSTPPAQQTQLQALAAPITIILILPSDSTRQVVAAFAASFPRGTVPLFQRDCSYLI